MKYDSILKVCQKCVEMVANQKRICKECSVQFTLQVGEARFLLAKGYGMPKRCGVCRGKEDSAGEAKTQRQNKQSTTNRPIVQGGEFARSINFTITQAPTSTPKPSSTPKLPLVNKSPTVEEASFWKKLKSIFD